MLLAMKFIEIYFLKKIFSKISSGLLEVCCI